MADEVPTNSRACRCCGGKGVITTPSRALMPVAALLKEFTAAHAAYLNGKRNPDLALREGYWYWKGERVSEFYSLLKEKGVLDEYGAWLNCSE